MSKKSPLVLSGAQIQQLQSSDYADIGIPYTAFKNRLFNGDFNIWQKGTSLTTLTSSGTIADRWRWTMNGSGANINVQPKSFSLGQTDVPDSPLYYMEASVSLAASGQTTLAMSQRIESAHTLEGQTATFSFYAKADSTRTLGVELNRFYGTGGSPSSTDLGMSGGTQNFTLTTSWQKFTATFTIPSMSGKTLGTNGDDYLEPLFFFPVNSAFTIDIAHCQFEAGPNATQFEFRPIGEELSLCRRYYERHIVTDSNGKFGMGFVRTTTRMWMMVAYKTPKRTTPTFSFSALADIHGEVGTSEITLSALAIANQGLENANIQADTASTLTVAQGCVLAANATLNAWIDFSCEL